MESEKSPLSPKFPNHSRLNTAASYGSVPTINTTEHTASDIFHESFLRNYSSSFKAYSDFNVQVDLETSTQKQNLLYQVSRKLSRLINDWWLWELVSWAIGTVCMVAIAIVMAMFNSHPLPARWPGGISLNAYISILSGAAKVMMAVPLEAALGQLKWLWFGSETPRQILDLERFDNASKGAWGALTLLISGSGRYVQSSLMNCHSTNRMVPRSLTFLGAAITILSLALDPFFQQVISYPQRPGPLQQSTIARAVGYTPNTIQITVNNTPEVIGDPDLWIYLSSFFLQNGTSISPAFDCPAGECTWPEYKTLGVCSSCTDVSDLLQFKCQNETGDWLSSAGNTVVPLFPNETHYPGAFSCGYFMDAAQDGELLMSGYTLQPNSSLPGEGLILRTYELQNFDSLAYNWSGSGAYSDIQSPIEHFIVVSAADIASAYANSTPVAQECMLSWCEKTIQSNFSGGQYWEQILSEYVRLNTSKVPDVFQTRVLDGIKQYAIFNVTVYGSDPSTTYFILDKVQLATRFMFGSVLPSFGFVNSSTSSLSIRWYNRQSFWPRVYPYDYNPWAPPNNISAYVQRFADAMTNEIRTNGGDTEEVIGSGLLQTYIEISWGWFALPLVLQVATLLLLLGTMRRSYLSSNFPVWKGSSLATLTYGLSDHSRLEIRLEGGVENVRDIAKNTRVTLQSTPEGYRLIHPTFDKMS